MSQEQHDDAGDQAPGLSLPGVLAPLPPCLCKTEEEVLEHYGQLRGREAAATLTALHLERDQLRARVATLDQEVAMMLLAWKSGEGVFDFLRRRALPASSGEEQMPAIEYVLKKENQRLRLVQAAYRALRALRAEQGAQERDGWPWDMDPAKARQRVNDLPGEIATAQAKLLELGEP